jgi:8-oxo-dGTP pyrophosphatase MutT (NUDIX family)
MPIPPIDSALNTRLPIRLRGHVVGSVLPQDATLYPLGINTQMTMGIDLPDELIACNAALADWAQALRAAQRLSTWRNELLAVAALPKTYAVLQDLPLSLAVVERGAARVLGIFTHAVHMVGLSAKGDIWLQQRALSKATDPGLWDSMAGGLLNSTDTLTQGVLRETYEEAGLTRDDLSDCVPCGMVQEHRYTDDGYIAQAVWAHRATLKPNVTPHNLDGEVMGFACVSRDTLLELIAAKQVSHEAILAFQLTGVITPSIAT